MTKETTFVLHGPFTVLYIRGPSHFARSDTYKSRVSAMHALTWRVRGGLPWNIHSRDLFVADAHRGYSAQGMHSRKITVCLPYGTDLRAPN